ncbi:MAG TPA: CvpA family protein [Candidatus Syntrophosphaera sp.]|jgi:membrane protein required for colicin V production|nr:CvpA family protein [Candidatus Syntrophosphaera sp.]HOH48445.1 CvpA family protein [Candidatus Syntrophosphaera sp.]HPW38520.1 CvpA family protein [Candidatus Syntrophosphaera sp.]HPX67451.1 CvpA family protein [Candidatus Syntrophosphaera sp.]HQC47095.1 CvpA family protein [Candidatus Syntrophosphaera sp.]
MGIIDWLILIILALSAFQGLRKGLVSTLVRVGAVIAVFMLIGQIFPLVKNGLIENLRLGLVPATLLAALLIIVVVAVMVGIVNLIFKKVLKVTKLSGLNKFLGLVFGFLNGLMVVIVLMVLLDYIPKLSTPLKDGSRHRVYVAVDTFKEDLFTVLKFEERDRFQQIKAKLKKDNNQTQTGK